MKSCQLNSCSCIKYLVCDNIQVSFILMPGVDNETKIFSTDNFFSAHHCNVMHAAGPYVGHRYLREQLDELRGQNCLPHLCFFDCKRVFSHT